MKRTILPLVALCLGVALLVPQISSAQNEEAQAEADAATESRGRLPYYFGKLGIGNEQREQLYEIDDEYTEQIEALEKQIKALEDERNRRMEALLTPGQKLRLKELREAAARRAAEKEAAEAAAAQAGTTTVLE